MDYGQWLLEPQQSAPSAIVAPVAIDPWLEKRKALAKAILDQQAKGNDYWQRTWEGADTVETKDVDQMPWSNVNGWAACDQKRKHCALVMRSKDPGYNQWLEHEQTHAAGFDHPKYKYNLEGFSNNWMPK
mgnify:FL=1